MVGTDGKGSGRDRWGGKWWGQMGREVVGTDEEGGGRDRWSGRW